MFKPANINIPDCAGIMGLSLLLGWFLPNSLILLIVCLVFLILKKGKRGERICYAISLLINLAWLGYCIYYHYTTPGFRF